MLDDETEDLVYDILEEFHGAYSKLVNDTLEKAPEHLRDLLLAMLQEKSSVYGVLK